MSLRFRFTSHLVARARSAHASPSLLLGAVLAALSFAPRARAQETPYFVAYSHHLEEPGNLEIETYSIYGTQKGHGDFIAPWMELEYGVTAWWTTEFYIDSQTTFGDSTVFTGTRWENRFRPLMHEHWINPVLYVEFENTTDADKTLEGGGGLRRPARRRRAELDGEPVAHA